MTKSFKIKPIHEAAVGEALAKAERYRLLNDPSQAESICRDVLRLQPDNVKALTTIVLALTDQFTEERGSAGTARAAREYVAKLTDEYSRLYYGGIVSERQARALLTRGLARGFAYHGLREAMDLFEQAEAVRPEGNDDAILRWNCCVRAIRQHDLRPREDDESFLLE